MLKVKREKNKWKGYSSSEKRTSGRGTLHLKLFLV